MPKLLDRKYEVLRPQDAVTFFPRTGKPRNAFVVGKDQVDKDRVSVLLIGDPFPVGVLPAHLQKGHDQQKGNRRRTPMAKTEEQAVDRKALRKAAKAKGIEGWQSMTTAELQSALGSAKAKRRKTKSKVAVTKAPRGKTKADRGEPVTPSQKAKATRKGPAKRKAKTEEPTPKKAKAAKKTTSRRTTTTSDDEDPIPFRKGSKSYLMAKLLIKGGTVRKMIDTLIAKEDLNPYKKKVKKLDVDFEWNKRILITAAAMEKAGFTITKIGRGVDNAEMRAYLPGAKLPKGTKPRVKQVQTKAAPVKAKKPKTGVKAKTAKTTSAAKRKKSKKGKLAKAA